MKPSEGEISLQEISLKDFPSSIIASSVKAAGFDAGALKAAGYYASALQATGFDRARPWVNPSEENIKSLGILSGYVDSVKDAMQFPSTSVPFI